MGLKAAQRPAFIFQRAKGGRVVREVVSGFIASLNEKGFASASGRPWRHSMVGYMLRMTGHEAEPIDQLHYRLMSQALGRGLSYRQIANQFNRKKIRLLGVLQTWTASSVERRWTKLNNLGEIRRPKISAAAEESKESTFKRSASENTLIPTTTSGPATIQCSADARSLPPVGSTSYKNAARPTDSTAAARQSLARTVGRILRSRLSMTTWENPVLRPKVAQDGTGCRI